MLRRIYLRDIKEIKKKKNKWRVLTDSSKWLSEE